MTKYSVAVTDPTLVEEYLVENYDVSEPRATDLMNKHKDVVLEGIALGSFAWYIGDRIADLESLEYREDEDE